MSFWRKHSFLHFVYNIVEVKGITAESYDNIKQSIFYFVWNDRKILDHSYEGVNVVINGNPFQWIV